MDASRKIALALALWMAAGLVPLFANSPNVIIILADDLGYGDLGVYGSHRFETPHIDRMAGEGVRLTRFYSPVPYCAPSRASLLTGRYPFRNGMVWNPSPDSGTNSVGIADDEMTLAEALKQAGYATLHIGKWHLGHLPRFYPTRHGFDDYYGILYSNDMRPVQLMEGERVVEYPVVQATLTRRYTERALQFIEAHKEKPFFLYLAHAMPHKPLAASEKFYKTSPAGLYGDVISELDWSVGQILNSLHSLGLEKSTLVFFLSDNGPWYGGSTGGLRGMKLLTWEGGNRVPMIARWPGQIPAGGVCEEPLSMTDIFPTVLARVGIPVPGDRVMDGVDIWPWLTGENSEPAHHALVTMAGARIAVVHSGKWKLHFHFQSSSWLQNDIRWVDPRGPDGVTILAPFEQPGPEQYPGSMRGDAPRTPMLFDLELDPWEEHDVSKNHADVVDRLTGIYEDFRKQFKPFPRPERHDLEKPGPRPSPN